MEIKKAPEVDLEKERSTFFLIGFAVILSTFFVLLEWQTPEPDIADLELLSPVFIENEYTGNIETSGILNEQTLENPLLEIIENSEPEFVYEDFNTVDKLIAEEETFEEMMASLQPDSMIQVMPVEERETIKSIQPDPDTGVYSQAEVMPQFPGGFTELIRYIYRNIQYPPVALKQRIQGQVWCSFIINEDGSIANILLEKGVYIFLDEEAIRVLEKMPNWIPGQIEGKTVRIKVYLPIVFKL
jgi:protein TonB